MAAMTAESIFIKASDIKWDTTTAVRAGVVWITPEVAARLLLANVKNRKRKPSREAGLSAAIQRGEWQLNGESIVISINGRLLDGQTRLSAIVQSGIPVRCVVVWGVADDVQSSIDIGESRTMGDILSMGEELSANELGAALSHLYFWYTFGILGRTGGTQAPTKAQLQDVLDSHPGVRDAVPWGYRLRALMSSRGLTIALAYIFAEIDAVAAETFLTSIEQGSGLEQNDPRLTLRETLIKDRSQTGSRSQMNQRRRAAIFVRAWNKWRKGEPLARLQWTIGDAFPVPQ